MATWDNRTASRRRQRPDVGDFNYNGLEVEAFLREMGLKRIRAGRDNVAFSCPDFEGRHYRGDVNPSAFMRRDNTQWRCFVCHDCGEGGNAATLLAGIEGISTREAHARLMRGEHSAPIKVHYQRRTDRCGGSLSEIHEQTAKAREQLDANMPYSELVDCLMELFRISKRTAKYRIAAARGTLQIVRKRGIFLGRRMMVATVLALNNSYEKLANHYRNLLGYKSLHQPLNEREIMDERSCIGMLRREFGHLLNQLDDWQRERQESSKRKKAHEKAIARAEWEKVLGRVPRFCEHLR